MTKPPEGSELNQGNPEKKLRPLPEKLPVLSELINEAEETAKIEELARELAYNQFALVSLVDQQKIQRLDTAAAEGKQGYLEKILDETAKEVNEILAKQRAITEKVQARIFEIQSRLAYKYDEFLQSILNAARTTEGYDFDSEWNRLQEWFEQISALLKKRNEQWLANVLKRGKEIYDQALAAAKKDLKNRKPQ